MLSTESMGLSISTTSFRPLSTRRGACPWSNGLVSRHVDPAARAWGENRALCTLLLPVGLSSSAVLVLTPRDRGEEEEEGDEEAGGSGDARDHLIQSLPHQQVPPGLDWRRRRRLRDIHGQPSRDRGRRFETRTPSPARQNGHSASDTRLHRTHHTPALQHRASRQIIIGKRGGFHVVLHLRHHRD